MLKTMWKKEVELMKVSIVGVTGYSGIELVRYLTNHPYVDIASIHGHRSTNETIDEVLPHMKQLNSLPIEAIHSERIMEASDLVFFATPSGISKQYAPIFIKEDFPLIDLSGDLRLKETGVYEKWYKMPAIDSQWLQEVDYGLAEYRTNPKAKWIANPGCYATATELSLAPLLINQSIELDSVIVDAKSGLSGAGKNFSTATHYVQAHDNMTLYKMNQHQHIPEIMQQLQIWEPEMPRVQFSTSLIPVTRGIFVTTYVKAKKKFSDEELIQLYLDCFADHPFIRIQSLGVYHSLKQVIGTNYCDIGLAYNKATNVITIVTVIDNLGKGAAGQAIQNLNIYAGFDEQTGLTNLPVYP